MAVRAECVQFSVGHYRFHERLVALKRSRFVVPLIGATPIPADSEIANFDDCYAVTVTVDGARRSLRSINMKNVFITLCSLVIHFARGQEFTYEGNRGPEFWGASFGTCMGKYQSPINIEEHNVRNVTLPPLKFIGFALPRITTIENNGHTVMLRAEGAEAAMITGGPLGNDIYTFEQLHFHWGRDDHEGSEAKLNNRSFAMELHAVFYNSVYGTMSDAVKHRDGLTVLAYFLEASQRSNPSYSLFVESLPYIEDPRGVDRMSDGFTLDSILIPNLIAMQNYFTYHGSLTTPPCSEVVTWIDFKQPFILSRKQIAAFRRIRGSEGHKLTHNFRPTQPLRDRVVYQNIPDGSEYSYKQQHTMSANHHRHPASSGQWTSRLSALLVLASLFLTRLSRC